MAAKTKVQQLQEMWERIGEAGEFDVSCHEDVDAPGNYGLEWYSEHYGWMQAAYGSLDYCLGYCEGRIDGEGL